MSLRARVLIGMALVALVLLATAVVVSRTTQSYLVGQVDEQLRRAARQGSAQSDQGAIGAGERFRRARPLQGPEVPSSLYVAVVVDGEVQTLRLPNLTRDPAGSPDLTAEQIEALEGGGIATVSSPTTDLRYRVVVPEGRRFTVAYALPLEDVERAVRQLRILEGFAVAIVMAVLGLVTFWVLRLGVRPVKSMTATAAAIGSGDLSQRIPESVPGTEAGDLGVALNAMLGRVETAFDTQVRSENRLRQFVADASHELRTPLATIRGYAELYRAGGLAQPEALDDAMRRTEQEAIRMGSLVEDLLGLARLDAGRPMRHDPVDLAAVVRDAGLDASAVEPDRTIVVDAPGPAVVSGDEALISQVVANLLANARVHTPSSSAIRVGARLEADAVVVEVADEGPGMSPEAAERAFERFFRADPGRGRASGAADSGWRSWPRSWPPTAARPSSRPRPRPERSSA